MRVNESKPRTYRGGILAIIVTCLSLLAGVLPAQNRVFLWGNNSNYQLGTTPLNWPSGNNYFGPTAYYGRKDPAYVRAFNTTAYPTGTATPAIACGYNHTLALRTDGTVWSGDNSYGQLGNGSYASNSDHPVQVVLPKSVIIIAIAAGGNHSMALASNGAVWTWGDNKYGEAGVGAAGGSFQTPVQVYNLPQPSHTVTAIAAGSDHCMALQENGVVLTWGYNSSGQLGDGTTTDHYTPTQVMSNANAISAGFSNSLARTGSDNAIWVWGYINTKSPAKVTGLTITAPSLTGLVSLDGFIGSGTYSTSRAPLVVKSDGTLWYLTSSNSTVQAVQVSGVSGVRAVSANNSFIVTLHTDNTVWCRGDNTYGEIGNNSTVTPQWNWTKANNITTAVQVQAGSGYAIAMEKKTGKLWNWGDNEYGQCAMPSPENQPCPTRPHIMLGSVVSAAVGSDGSYAHYLFLHKDGTVWGLGRNNNHGQLGNGGTIDSFTAITPVYNASFTGLVKQVAASRDAASYAITSDHKLWAWGNNASGQLGDGTTTDSYYPKPVLTDVIAVAPGTDFVLALKSDGSVWAWGYNYYGQLGDGTGTNRYSPQQVPGLTGITAIAAGDEFSLALKNDGTTGTVYSWGDNRYGSGSTPTLVSGLPSIQAIAAGTDHALALTSDGTGTVYSWGSNSEGELGIGTTSGVSVPQQVMTGVKAISAGNDGYGQSFAIKSDNTIWAWGNDTVGQLGDGVLTPAGADRWDNDTIAQPTPTQVFLPGVNQILSCGGVTMALVKDVEPDLKGDGTTDANGDSTTDLFLQNSSTKQQQIWYMTGITPNGQLNPFGAAISTDFNFAGAADLNGDGLFDLLWRSKANGNVNGWLMNGTAAVSYDHIYTTTPTDWDIVGVADTNNDGSPDMIWQDNTKHQVKVIYLSGGKLIKDSNGNTKGDLLLPTQSVTAPNGLPATWKVVGTADMDGDGYADLIAQDSATHAVRVWYLKGSVWTGAYDDLAPAQTGSNILRLASIQDLDGDSQPDLIWQAGNGDVTCWQMDSIIGQILPTRSINNAAGWSVARAH